MKAIFAFYEKINKIVENISEGLSFAGALWMFVLMIVVVMDVLGRKLFNSPLVGATEIVRNSIIGIAFFMIPWAIVEDRHVRSMMLIDKLSARGAKIINFLAYTLAFIIFIGIIKGGWTPMIKATLIREYEGEGALRVPTYPVRMLIILGSLFSAWHCLYRLYALVKPAKLLGGAEQ